MEPEKRRLLTNKPPTTQQDATAGTAADGEVSASGGTTSANEGSQVLATRPTSRLSVSWRVGVTLVALVILTCGQFLNTNDFFPLGSLTQYATAKDLNGTVNSTCIRAQFPGEEKSQKLAFNAATVGIERGDVEAQLQRVIDNPELLQPLAESYVRLHPGEPEPEKIILCRTTTQLENGIRVGDPKLTTLASWEVK